MTIITETGEKPDDYRRVETEDDIAGSDGKPLLPLALFASATPALDDQGFGVSVANDTPMGEIEPLIGRADLIAVEFPSFSDGRGLSLAKRIRRAGFVGTLRASGPLIADQFAEALACGFDEVELPQTMANRQPVQQWMAAKDAVHDHYQSGYGDDLSILQKRLAARREARG